MSEIPSRRGFIKGAIIGLAGVIPLISGCIAPRVSLTAREESHGQPWRCSNCGHLTRTNDDISGDRCPRCMAKQLKRVTETEFAEYLKKEAT